MKIKVRRMNTLETEHQVNEQGMILEEIHKLKIDDVIQSIQEIDKEIEKLILKNRFRIF